MTSVDPKPAQGLRKFSVESRHNESDVITSFVLRPLDGKPPAPHKAGQFLTMLVDIPGTGPQKHNYTISTKPNGETYRISVKREPNGLVSKWLHDKAKVGTELAIAPAEGDFVLPERASRPIVMLSGGVGLTPMVAMLEAAVQEKLNVPIQFVHATQDGGTHAFGKHLANLAATGSNVTITTFYSAPRAQDVAARDYDIAGRVDMKWLQANSPIADADYYVCGPLSFLRSFVPGLAAAGVSKERLHYEFFGPIEDLFEEGSGTMSSSQSGSPSPSASAYHAKAAGDFTREFIGDGILDSAADAIVVSDYEGLIVLWNAGAQRIFGFTEQEALGQSLDIIIPEPFRARHWSGYRETAASGQSRYGAGDMLAVPGLCKDGRRISIEFTIALLKDNSGAVKGMAAVIRDVTKKFEETKALKKQLAALQPTS
jgi:PAS domain S-box-containing protein